MWALLEFIYWFDLIINMHQEVFLLYSEIILSELTYSHCALKSTGHLKFNFQHDLYTATYFLWLLSSNNQLSMTLCVKKIL